jgi:hypothetical protein
MNLDQIRLNSAIAILGLLVTACSTTMTLGRLPVQKAYQPMRQKHLCLAIDGTNDKYPLNGNFGLFIQPGLFLEDIVVGELSAFYEVHRINAGNCLGNEKRLNVAIVDFQYSAYVAVVMAEAQSTATISFKIIDPDGSTITVESQSDRISGGETGSARLPLVVVTREAIQDAVRKNVDLLVCYERQGACAKPDPVDRRIQNVAAKYLQIRSTGSVEEKNHIWKVPR